MTIENIKNDSDLSTQEYCIDLPGEPVQCWIGGGTDKLKIILRKHRDVIFDIHLGNGKTYTLEATESDFYNARDKKLIFAARHGKVFFRDGERLHVWVSRNFRGELVIKSDGRSIYKVDPNKWDKHQHSEDPKEKPAPIIVSIDADVAPATTTAKTPVPFRYGEPVKSPASIPVVIARAASAPVQDFSCPVVCVVDGKVEGMPAEIAEHFKKGGDHSGFSDIDPNHVLTRNWIWGQIAGTGAYVKDNWEWLRASLDGKTSQGFKLVKAQVHYVRGKVRFYFSGYSNRNTIFGRGGFGPSHERIMTIFSGAGKTSSAFKSVLKGVAGSFKGNALASFIFGTATAVAEWKNDINKDGYDLAAALITTTIKAILVASVVVLVVAGIVWLVMVVIGSGISVIVVGAVTIVVGFLANYVIEAADKFIGRAATHDSSNTDGTASLIAPWIRKQGKVIQENWRHLMDKMPNDYKEIYF